MDPLLEAFETAPDADSNDQLLKAFDAAPDADVDADIARATSEGRAEKLEGGVVRVHSPDKRFSQVFDPKSGKRVLSQGEVRANRDTNVKEGMLQTALGLAQAVSPFSDEIAAGVRFLGDSAKGKSRAYSDVLREVRSTTDEASRRTPIEAQLAAGLASGIATGGANIPATFAGRSGVNALVGGIQGYGASSRHDLSGRMGDAAIGALFSAGLGAGAEGVGVGLKKGAEVVAPYVRRLGEKATLKALGLFAGIDNKLQKKGIDVVRDVPEFVDEIQATGIIKPFRNTAETLAELEREKARVGASLSQAIERADRAGKFSGEKAKEDILAKISALNELEKDFAGKAAQTAEAVGRQGNISFADAVDLKRTAQKTTNYALDVPVAQDVQRQAASALRQSIEDQMSAVAGPDVASQYVNANKAFQPLMDASSFLEDDVARQYARNGLSVSDLLYGGMIAGPLGLSLGGPGGMAAAQIPGAIMSNFIRTRGPSAVAKPLLSVAEGLQRAADFSAPQLTKKPILTEYIQRLSRIPKQEREQEGIDAYERAH